MLQCGCVTRSMQYAWIVAGVMCVTLLTYTSHLVLAPFADRHYWLLRPKAACDCDA